MKRALAFLVLAAGCAAEPTWYREGATDRDFRMEQAQCRVEVAKVGSPYSGGGASDALANAAISDATYKNCLIGKGWEARAK